MVEAFSQRDIISNVISMGHTLLLLVAVFMGYLAAKRTTRTEPLWILVNSLISGLIVGGLLALFVILGSLINLRKVFVYAMPVLYELLTFKQGTQIGIFLLLGAGALSGVLAGLFFLAPKLFRRMVIISLTGIVGAGVLQDMLRPTFALWGPLAVINEWLYAANGLTLHGAIGLFILITAIIYFWNRKGSAVRTGVQRLPPAGQRALRITSLPSSLHHLVYPSPDSWPLPERSVDHRGPLCSFGLGIKYRRRLCWPLGSRLRGLLRHWCLHDGRIDLT